MCRSLQVSAKLLSAPLGVRGRGRWGRGGRGSGSAPPAPRHLLSQAWEDEDGLLSFRGKSVESPSGSQDGRCELARRGRLRTADVRSLRALEAGSAKSGCEPGGAHGGLLQLRGPRRPSVMRASLPPLPVFSWLVTLCVAASSPSL